MLVIKLAIKDLLFEKWMSLCTIISLCAIVCPLLVLYSLRFGIITTLQNDIIQNPKNTCIEFVNGPKLTLDFLKELERRDDIVVVIPQMRNVANHVRLQIRNESGRHKVDDCDVSATKNGDPLISKSGLNWDLDLFECYVSASLANEAKLKIGDKINCIVDRIYNGNHEQYSETFVVKGVIKASFDARNSIYVNLKVNEAITDVRDGFNPALFTDGTNERTPRSYYNAAKIYVKDIYAIERLVSQLEGAGYFVDSSINEVNEINKTKETLDFIFLVIALSSFVCALLVLIGFISSLIKDKKKTFALMRLYGIEASKIKFMVVFEQVLLSFLAITLALALYAIVSYVFDVRFASLLGQGNVVSVLLPLHIVSFYFVGLALSAIVAFIAISISFSCFDIASTLREV